MEYNKDEQEEAFNDDEEATLQPPPSPTFSVVKAVAASSYYFRGTPSPPQLEPRQRLDTEETALIRNGNQPSRYFGHLDNQESDDHEDDESEEYEDDLSDVSGLSNDEDSLIMTTRATISSPMLKRVLPPSEVMITMSPSSDEGDENDSFVDGLVARMSFRPLPPPLTTTGPSPVVPRPTMNRHSSCPSTASAASFPSLPSLPVDSRSINSQGTRHIHNDHSSEYSKLLGQRKRHFRIPSSASVISVGTLVGQSSLKTAPTISSEVSSDASAVKRLFEAAHQTEKLLQEQAGVEDFMVRRKTNIVKEEMKYMLGVVVSPMRKIPFLKPKPVDLVRSKGTLT
jgi:hypothetical protein